MTPTPPDRTNHHMNLEDPITNDSEIRVSFARMEAKLDVALAQHGAKLEQHGSDITILREDGKERDIRLLNLERTPTVTPRALAGTAFAIIAAVGTITPLLDRLYN